MDDEREMLIVAGVLLVVVMVGAVWVETSWVETSWRKQAARDHCRKTGASRDALALVDGVPYFIPEYEYRCDGYRTWH
jgi:hypothetical protein